MTKVIYYTTALKESPALEFLRSLSLQQERKVRRVLAYIETYGLTTAIRHIKKLTGTPLWEIRILGQDNIRVLYATEDRDAIIILHGFIKKSPRTPIKEVETALQRLVEWKKPKDAT
ncbi:MAG: type II toxin-antitoxin system RelE/ParE family toxin [Candidatus Blackburnbacteria bacterium]|nr:type II toxin-antitoxin system RelE/ParE family toxin [Candidatus Blackburnbacteria bacterium]